VVVSVGGSAVTPRLPGVEQENVIQAIDLFRKPELAAKAQNVVVVGGGAVGCEAAQFLSAELGKRVTVIEMLPTIMPGVCTANRGYLIHELENLGVLLRNCTRLVSIEGNNVKLARNTSPTVPDPYVTWTPLLPENINNPFAKPIKEQIEEQTIQAELVVLAMGLRSEHGFYQACVTAQAAPEVIELGDAFQIGRVFEAVKSGSLVGRNL
jgi:2-enoate reductase